MLHKICQSLHFVKCAVQFELLCLGLRFSLGLGSELDLRVRVRVRFGSEICELHTHDFETAKHILQIAQMPNHMQQAHRQSMHI